MSRRRAVDASASGTSGKAGRLIAARRAGLPVPPCLVVADGEEAPTEDQLARWLAAEGVAVGGADHEGGSARRASDVPAASPSSGPRPAPDVDRLRVAVRSAFSAEDADDSSMAGWFESELRVELGDVAEAVERVRASAERAPSDAGALRRDVLVMLMVEAEHSGVAFSEPETYDDLVNVTTGTAERLVGGAEEGESVSLARLEREPEGWMRRVQQLLAELRSAMGDQPWDIEWADDGEVCWLIQVRPITSPPKRNEAFTIANHAEILPPLPSQLMVSVIAGAGQELFGWYRRFDSTLPANRPFLEVFSGRPFINLTLLEDLLRHLGLPTRLVADSIGGPPDNDRPGSPRRVARKLPVLVRLGVGQISAVALAKRTRRKAADVGATPAASFADALDELHRGYVGLVTGMFPLSSAIGPPLSALRRAGTLVEHAGRHRTITSELAEAVDAVGAGELALDAFLERFGHRGVYESDIARPRYRDDVALLGTSEGGAVEGVSEGVGGAPIPTMRRRTVRGVLTWPVWAFARGPLAAREQFRHDAMLGFANVRASLVRLAQGAVENGQLRRVDDLWLLDVDEAVALDGGWAPDTAFWAEREAERERLAELDPPAVIHRFDDPATWRHDAPVGDRLTGIPLTNGTVRGKAWVLREPSLEVPAGFDREHTVLIARSVDAGWIPTFARVAAVVAETGGDLSHGSILLRERGVPAITNVRGALRFVETGDDVEVRADSGVLERLPST